MTIEINVWVAGQLTTTRHLSVFFLSLAFMLNDCMWMNRECHSVNNYLLYCPLNLKIKLKWDKFHEINSHCPFTRWNSYKVNLTSRADLEANAIYQNLTVIIIIHATESKWWWWCINSICLSNSVWFTVQFLHLMNSTRATCCTSHS